MDRRTKIVATLGPATNDQHMIERLMKAGVNVVRLNFSHGTHDEHAARIAALRQASEQLGLAITLLQDLQGPKIRTGEITGGSANLTQGQSFVLTTRPVPGDEHMVSVDVEDLPNSVHPGGRILLDDGNLELAVVGVTKDTVETKVVLGGALKPHKGVNLPGAKLNIPSFTEKDEEDLKFGLESGIDAVAMSFVRTAGDVVRVRQAINRLVPDRKNTTIIAKLERPEALDNLDAILEVTDGVMVARGDLGVEMSPESVPIAQKQIIEAANRKGRVVITATQMLESMINSPRPTRAEASDVANAIFDGTDAVMLSGETAVGKYPVQSVEMMDAIIRKAEAQFSRWGRWAGDVDETPDFDGPAADARHDDALSTTRAARELAHDRNVAAIAIFTQTGRTARLMSKARPGVPILAFTPEKSTYQQCAMLWGVIPYLVPYASTLEAMIKDIEEAIISETPLQPCQQVVLVSGFPVGALRPPNFAMLHTIGEKC
ncbi:MAG: pyruvate kinase [Chloroflexota bacterium]|nr:MAG: pyruvate kinase [Chloroflexota bacterium]